MTSLLNIKKHKSLIKDGLLPEGHLYIARENHWLGLIESKWGNPFYLARESERPNCLKQYLFHVLSRQDLIDSLHEIDNKILVCYCYPKLCHGNVLIELRKMQLEGIELTLEHMDECLVRLGINQ